jgi:uncharacterized protein YidB (DUF937 family)
MALLDVVLGNVTGSEVSKHGRPDARHAELVQGLVAMLASGSGGGLTALLAHLQRGGLGEAVGSWVSTGNNQPVTGEQLQSVLPADVIASLAAKAGIDSAQVPYGLAQVLPSIVDQLSPSGALPSERGLQSALGGLSRMLSGTG